MTECIDKKVVIIGGGPAGLTAAYQLSKAGVQSIVLEKDAVVGGLSRTVEYKGYHFDIGGHRFFTKVKAVDQMWREVLSQNEFLRRPRLSRIYYEKQFYHYPLQAFDALSKLGAWNASLIIVSYLRAQLFPIKNELTFEQWVTNRFGKRLYKMFFKTYTEKVWGIPCNEIQAEWAAQRIKGLSLVSAIKNALIKPKAKIKDVAIKTLIDEFDYPLFGPGMMWKRMAELIQQQSGEVQLEATVEKLIWSANKISAVEVTVGHHLEQVKGSNFISSMPLRELIRKLDPPAPAEVLTAAENLKYRDFVTVAIIVNKSNLFPDNWIYVHDPTVKLGRIQNFKNWSTAMVPDETKTCLGLEYFCFEGDGLWEMTDENLIELGTRELMQIGLIQATDVEDAAVVRMPKAYPIYDSCYHTALKIVRTFLESFDNLQMVGRNGMHRYNNQDHSMLTAMLAVENIFGANHDLWEVNADEEYHEETVARKQLFAQTCANLASTQPKVPRRI